MRRRPGYSTRQKHIGSWNAPQQQEDEMDSRLPPTCANQPGLLTSSTALRTGATL